MSNAKIGVEIPRPLYMRDGILPEDYQFMRRVDAKGGRLYAQKGPDGNWDLYNSVTTVLEKCYPDDKKHLMTWHADNGRDAFRILKETSNFGTLMHEACTEFTRNGFDFDEIDKLVDGYLYDHGLHYSREKWIDRLQKNLASWAQFVHEKEYVPLVSELVIGDPELAIAGAVDCVGWITHNRKRRLILIDMKSRMDKGFLPPHMRQLMCYEDIWNKKFPDYKIELIANWGPKSWTGDTPSYNLKIWKPGSKDRDMLHHALEYGRRFHAPQWPKKKQFSGILQPGEKPEKAISIISVESLLEELDAEEFANANKRNTETQD